MDINDVFDNIVMYESLSNQEGYKEGLEKGNVDGNYEGFHLGYHRGAEFGAEIGFFYGVIKTLITLNERNFLYCSEKASKSIHETIKLIEEFPQVNVKNIDLHLALDNIRSSYKKSLSYLKIKCEYPEKDYKNF